MTRYVLFLITCTISVFQALSYAQEEEKAWHPEDKELRLSLLPGFLQNTKTPTGFSKKEFAIETDVTYFLHPHLGLYVPYRYVKFNNTSSHKVGGGLNFRAVDFKGFQVELLSNLNYNRLIKKNKMGFGAGVFSHYQWNRSKFFQPAIGPFFMYDQTFLPGKDLVNMTVGLALHLSGHSDMDW